MSKQRSQWDRWSRHCGSRQSWQPYKRLHPHGPTQWLAGSGMLGLTAPISETERCWCDLFVSLAHEGRNCYLLSGIFKRILFRFIRLFICIIIYREKAFFPHFLSYGYHRHTIAMISTIYCDKNMHYRSNSSLDTVFLINNPFFSYLEMAILPRWL